jgi:superfamily II DNA or RNA helicase
VARDRIKEIQLELARLAARREELERELASLKTQPLEKPRQSLTTIDSHVDLFLSMFRCRESVYPKLWENRAKGTSGYSPACTNEWVKGVCGKPPNGRVKCSECPNQAFPSLDEDAVRDHLNGRAIIGTYAIREDDTCVFLACDFDGSAWQEDAFLYKRVAAEVGVEVLVERSRSGNGAHTWIFFEQPVPARAARALGTLILSKCGEVNDRMGLESFDRFFPNQDYLPKGGFGNLIALPFQKAAVQIGNTVFVDESLRQVDDQWAALADLRRVSVADLNRMIGSILVTRKDQPEDDLALATDSKFVDRSIDVRGLLPSGFPVQVVVGAQLTVPLDGLPPKVVTGLQRLASFANPEFFKLQRMRMATFPHPRFIFSGEKRPNEILLPRGLLVKVTKLLERAGATISVLDLRRPGAELDLEFEGTLTERQQMAVTSLLSTEDGIFVAPPGSGKTVIACAVISERKTSTLILVHKQPLIDQWRTQLTTLLGLEAKQVGVLAGAKKKRTGIVDIAMLQSLVRSQDCAKFLSEYGQVIVDECHHVPATSFEAVMKQCTSRYLLGLTATPKRKDSLEVLLYQQCGPVRHEISIGEGHSLAKSLNVRPTVFRLQEEHGQKPPYHVIAELLATDEARNRMIADDIVEMLGHGRFSLVLADRKDQVKALESMVRKSSDGMFGIFCLEGLMSPKRRRQMLTDIATARENGKPTVLLATASLVGEGFDLPDLDTLFLASPISFEGRLVQYVGRLDRAAEGKAEVEVFDYVDASCAVLLKMYRGRLKTFQKLGYDIPQAMQTERRGPAQQPNLFGD